MTAPPLRLYFDYVDPISFLQDSEVAAVENELGISVERVPLELRPPPAEMLDPDDPVWLRRVAQARVLAAQVGMDLTLPSLIPWTRKAHELVLHAAGEGEGEAMHRRIFDAVFLEGRDIGRVDVLMTLAQGVGLDFTRTKATLDVDLHAGTLEELRRGAREEGVDDVPTLTMGERRLRGFHNRNALGTFLHANEP